MSLFDMDRNTMVVVIIGLICASVVGVSRAVVEAKATEAATQIKLREIECRGAK